MRCVHMMLQPRRTFRWKQHCCRLSMTFLHMLFCWVGLQREIWLVLVIIVRLLIVDYEMDLGTLLFFGLRPQMV